MVVKMFSIHYERGPDLIKVIDFFLLNSEERKVPGHNTYNTIQYILYVENHFFAPSQRVALRSIMNLVINAVIILKLLSASGLFTGL